jgi:hypothetical protein
VIVDGEAGTIRRKRDRLFLDIPEFVWMEWTTNKLASPSRLQFNSIRETPGTK